jgi:hypothetical protein
VVKQKRKTWTYLDQNGEDLGQNYLDQKEDGQDKNVGFFLNILFHYFPQAYYYYYYYYYYY